MRTEQRWQARFRAARISLPKWALEAPVRSVYHSNTTGTWEIYAWERQAGVIRQVTDRPKGTSTATIDPRGEWVWWFADTDGDEFGSWQRQPFSGGPDEPAIPGLEASYPAGLALGSSGTAVVGRGTEGGTSVHVARPGSDPITVYHHHEDAHVVDLSRDESLIAINHSEHGDSRHMALRAMRLDGSTVAELWDGPGRGLDGVRFTPVRGDSRLLVIHERRGRPEPLIWDPVTGEQQEIWLELPGEIAADWYPEGEALLIVHQHRARAELYRYDLHGGQLERIDTPRGEIMAATARPDGTVEYWWTSSAQPPMVRSTTGQEVLHPPGPPAPPSVPVEDAYVDGPGGPIHLLVSRPETELAPFPTVFRVHGGPDMQDTDAFNPEVAAWVDHGFAVVQVNYRGSAGYGSAWRDAIQGRAGVTEWEDIKAAREWAVASGLANPSRLVLTGGSWGGFLTLLGLGLYPEDWTIGIAAVPVADYVTAYYDEMEALQAFDRALFGGSPDEVPERYERASPISYVERLLAPVLILAGENDPRCPIRQIDNYLARLAEAGKVHEVYRFDAGHGSLVVEERIRHMAAALDFAHKHLKLG